MGKDIKTRNTKGQLHGYQLVFHNNGGIWLRCNYKHGLELGYEELHKFNETNFYIR